MAKHLGSHRETVVYNDGYRVREWLGTSRSADKTVPQGNELLLPITDQVLVYESDGNHICDDPLYDVGLERIMEIFEPKHKVALLSLCTATRPYSKSVKWSTFIERYNGLADLIVMSSGGLIPIEFECCYPFLNYNDIAPNTIESQVKFVEAYVKRLHKFFSKFHYEKVVFAFKYDALSVTACKLIMPKLVEAGLVGGFVCVPSEEQYNAHYKGRNHTLLHKYNPLIYPELLSLIDAELGYQQSSESDINLFFK